MSSPGQWGSSAPKGHSGTQFPYIMLPLHPLGVGIVISCVTEAGSPLVSASGEGKSTEAAHSMPEGLDPAVVRIVLLTLGWQEVSQTATPTCKGGWEMLSSRVPRKNGKTDFGRQLAVSTK